MLQDSLRLKFARTFRELRRENKISQLQVADIAEVNRSVVNRAERNGNAKIDTWEKLFEALGYWIEIRATEHSEDWPGWMAEESWRREGRRNAGLCAGKRRFY